MPQRVAQISVEQYHRLGEFNEIGRRTELIRGIIIEKPRKLPLHSFIATRLYKTVLRNLPDGFTAWSNDPLTFADSEPEPDVSVVRGSQNDFNDAHPTTAALVVEIAVNYAALDRELASLYAEAGVEEYWIVVGRERAVEVYRHPVNGMFQEKLTVSGSETLTCASVPGLSVSLAELFA